MWELAPRFFTEEEILRIVMYYGFLFPLSFIAVFLFLYNRAQERRIKEEREKQAELTKFRLKEGLKERTNGHKIHE